MKIILKESQQNKLKLSPFIYKAVVNKRTSLGDNPAIPNYGEFGFEYDILKKRFQDARSKIDTMLDNGEIDSDDPEYLINLLGKLVARCRKLEKPLRPQLEKICENYVNKALAIPPETVLFKCRLTDKITPKHEMRILPEDDSQGGSYTFEDIDEIDHAAKSVLKRRFINAMIQGISYSMSDILTMDKASSNKINEMCEPLIGIWSWIREINDYLLFIKEEKISDKNPMQGAYVEVHIGKKGRKSSIDAQGLIFPYLLQECFRGFFELFSSHGLPEDDDKAMYIVKKADFLVAEPWDLRLGTGIWDRIYESSEELKKADSTVLPYLFDMICSLPTDKFNNVMQNVLAGTKKGEKYISQAVKEIKHDTEYQQFKDRITQMNVDASLIQDGYFTKDELDDLVIEEEI